MCGKWLKGIKKHKYNCVRKFKKSVVLFVLSSILRLSWFKSKPLQRIKKNESWRGGLQYQNFILTPLKDPDSIVSFTIGKGLIQKDQQIH